MKVWSDQDAAPLGNTPLFAGICLWIQVRREVRPLAVSQWALGFLAPSPLADTAGPGDTRDGCRSAVDIWAVP